DSLRIAGIRNCIRSRKLRNPSNNRDLSRRSFHGGFQNRSLLVCAERVVLTNGAEHHQTVTSVADERGLNGSRRRGVEIERWVKLRSCCWKSACPVAR